MMVLGWLAFCASLGSTWRGPRPFSLKPFACQRSWMKQLSCRPGWPGDWWLEGRAGKWGTVRHGTSWQNKPVEDATPSWFKGTDWHPKVECILDMDNRPSQELWTYSSLLHQPNGSFCVMNTLPVASRNKPNMHMSCLSQEHAPSFDPVSPAQAERSGIQWRWGPDASTFGVACWVRFFFRCLSSPMVGHQHRRGL